MLKYDEIINIFMKHNYIMRTSELRASRVYYDDIQKLLADGVIQKLRQGYYCLVCDNDIEENLIYRLFPDAVMCMDTALFFYEYSDRTPSEWHLAVDKNISRYRIKIDYPFVRKYYYEPEILSLGVALTENGSDKLRIYDRDRTICDCLRYMGKIDRELFNKAVQGYIADSKKSIPNLIKYSKILRVQKKVKDLIGVWL